MIRIHMTTMFALLLLITAGTVVGAEMAKEGNGEYRSGKNGTFVTMVVLMDYERNEEKEDDHQGTLLNGMF